MAIIHIEELDTVYSKIMDMKLCPTIRSDFCYGVNSWSKGRHFTTKREWSLPLIDKQGVFLSGFVPRVTKILGANHKVIYKKLDFPIPDRINPYLPDIDFRDDQLRLINSALEKKRGVILAVTGSGKTIVMAGIISCFPEARILFLVRKIDLVDQTIKVFTDLKLGTVSKFGGGFKDLSGRIIVSTTQSFSLLKPSDYCDKFDMVFSDECHTASKFYKGQFYKIMSNLYAPMRFGFTATLPTNEETKCVLEGLTGEVIDSLSHQEATDLEILAVPKVKLIKVDPFDSTNIRRYQDIYDQGIVKNRLRNRQILKEIKKCNEAGLSTITFVQRIEHIERLLDLASSPNLYVPLYAVMGIVKSDERLKIKKALQNKTIMNVVATVVWVEGLNIPSLDTIILAGGGKSEKDLIQSIGRGLRRTETKKEALIIDFVDEAKYLSQHFCARLGVYVSKGWL